MERIVNIDHKQHKIILLIELIIFNLVLVFALLTLCIVCKVWYVYLIAVILLLTCLIYSIVVFIKNKNLNIYKLTNDSLYIRNEIMEINIKYSEIVKISFKKSFVDILTSRGAQTLIIHTTKKNYEKIYLYFIGENLSNLANEILSKTSEINQKTI